MKNRWFLITMLCFLFIAAAVAFCGIWYWQKTQIANVGEAIDAITDRFGEYDIGEHSAEYEKLLSEAESASHALSVKRAEAARKALSRLESEVVEENREAAQARYDELDGADLSAGFSEEKDYIKDLKQSAASLISGGKFKSAAAVMDEWSNCIASLGEVSDELNIEILRGDTSAYPTVKLYVNVTDVESGDALDELDKDEFLLRESTNGGDYETAEIRAVRSGDERAATLAFVIDTSDSAKPSGLIRAQSVIGAFLNDVRFSAGDKVLFRTTDGTAGEATGNKSDAKERLNALSTGGGRKIYDALYAAVQSLSETSGAKAVFAYVQGADEYSSHTAENVASLASDSGVSVYIAYIEDEENAASAAADKLSMVAIQSGGGFETIESMSDLVGVYGDFYDELKSSYEIEYKSALPECARSIILSVKTAGESGSAEYGF